MWCSSFMRQIGKNAFCAGETEDDAPWNVEHCDDACLELLNTLAQMLAQFQESADRSTHWKEDKDNECSMSNGEDS